MVDNHSALVRWFDEELLAQQAIDKTLTDDKFCRLAGLSRSTVMNWRKGHMPALENFNSALKVLGYRLKVEEDT